METDLYNNHYLNDCTDLLINHPQHLDIYIAKKNKKTEIAERLIENNIDLSNWHIIKDIINEFEGN